MIMVLFSMVNLHGCATEVLVALQIKYYFSYRHWCFITHLLNKKICVIPCSSLNVKMPFSSNYHYCCCYCSRFILLLQLKGSLLVWEYYDQLETLSIGARQDGCEKIVRLHYKVRVRSR